MILPAGFPVEMAWTSPGTYALALRCTRRRRLAVGALGTFDVVPGYYLYVGSAFGPGGLRSRLLRHLSKTGRRHWHIDFLRQVTTPTLAWTTFDGTKREHEWASALARQRGASILMPHFGASDCRCPSHLFYSEKPWPTNEVKSLLESAGRSPAEVHTLDLSVTFA
jgi:Uri superfamily endonuclease